MPRWLCWSAWGLIFTAAAGVGLISSGLFDPRPIGAETWSLRLAALSIPMESRQTIWLEQVAAKASHTVRLTAAYGSGELDAAYGLFLGADSDYLAVAVSPTGYAAIWRGDDGHSTERMQRQSFIVPWQVWPHVKYETGSNEIWLDVSHDAPAGNRLTVRINRELFWSGEIGLLEGGIAYFGESFGDPVEIDFQEIRLFSEP